jgi:hypothetical protein
MSEYDDILEKAREAGEQFKSRAKEFIQKMYHALRSENSNISAEDARDRIEKDCFGIWSRRTILDALPDEAKNPEKQKAGRLSQKKYIPAALVAAPLKRKVIFTSTQGSIESNNEREALNNLESNNANNLSEKYRQQSESTFQKEERVIKKQETAYTQPCGECQELRIKLRDYEEALGHVPFIVADQIGKSNVKYQIPKERHHLLEDAVRKCSQRYYLNFDPIGNLISAEPDISSAK